MKLSQSLSYLLKLSGILSFYLTEHRNIMSRRLHAVEVALVYTFSKAIRKKQAKYALYGLVSGYTCAWVDILCLKK